MVFSNLGVHEKQAFFDLLDEYFTSRPELLASLGASASPGTGSESAAHGGLSGPNSRAAASAVHSALAANPEATANLISSGLRHGSQNSSVKNSPFASAASDPSVSNSIGRVAAASLAFSQRNANSNLSPPSPAPPVRNTPPPPPAPRSMPPVLPRRTSSTSPEQEEYEDDGRASSPPTRPPISRSSSGSSSLVQRRSVGDVDTTSFKAGFVSVKNSTSNKKKGPPAVAPPLPSAFPKRVNNFGPPPVRRLTSDSGGPPPPPARVVRTPEPEPEPEEQGEWAEALYDYDSGEAGDLPLRAHQHVKIVLRDSDDWWTGEVDGKSGLFPASYVREL